MGILYVMTIDPSISSSPFVCVEDISSCSSEEEILFSMHTVFRISPTEQIGDRLWQVQLSLTNEDDQELKRLTEYMRQETHHITGWHRIADLLFKIGKFDNAKEVYDTLLKDTVADDEEAQSQLYHQLGSVKCKKAEYSEALKFCEKALHMRQTLDPPNHLLLADTYNNIALVHDAMAEYSKALDCYGGALKIRQESLPPKHPD
jgi:tetratricopeptide (TPR) repeat protein